MDKYLELKSGEHTYPFFFGVWAVRKFSQKHPDHPITALTDKTPMDVMFDLVITGIEGGYKWRGKEIPEEVMNRLECETTIEDFTGMISQIFRSEKNDPEPKKK